jgi:integrase
MARVFGKLSALAVGRAKRPGYYGDGGGLFLQVSASGAKSWVFRFKVNGRTREMGLGPLHAVTLAEARAAATECRRLRVQGVDPIEARKAERLQAATGMTFLECSSLYIAAHKAGWRNPKHAAQWASTLARYADPVFGDLPVAAIDVGLVMKAVEPIWATKTETASRLRGRIESVLDWATARGYRQGENPARWRGHLDNLLPKRAKVQKVQHHPALPYTEIASFMQALRSQQGMAALALEFCILTATRTSETIGARWDEIDLAAELWTIPASRIKAGREHRVPLSEPVVSLLGELAATRTGEFIFPGGRAGRPLSNAAMLALLKRMGRGDLTVHGFRSAFRDWTAEQTNHPRDVAEMALAHTIGDKVEAAYRRGDLFDKRRLLMADWAHFCSRGE